MLRRLAAQYKLRGMASTYACAPPRHWGSGIHDQLSRGSYGLPVRSLYGITRVQKLFITEANAKQNFFRAISTQHWKQLNSSRRAYGAGISVANAIANAAIILSCNTECTVEYVFALICLFKAGQLVNEGNMTVEDFLESNHQLRVQQQTAREEEEDRADDMEAEELNNLRQVLY